MREPLRTPLRRLIPLGLDAAAALYLLLPARAPLGTGSPLTLALLAVLGVLFALHSGLSLRLGDTVAFLVGLEIAYTGLVLAQSARAPFLGLDLENYARAFALIVPLTLILIYTLGRSSLLEGRGFLRVGVTATLPLLWAAAARLWPGVTGKLLGARLAVIPWPFALPQPGVALFAVLGLVLLAARSGRSLYDFCVAVSLVPCCILLERAAAGPPGDFSRSLAVSYALVFSSLLYGLYRLFWQRAFLDDLTGLGNRRSFDDALRTLPREYSLAMVDIDHFKSINDSFGHSEGDNVLRWVAGNIRASFGARAFRYGGEEFAVILPEWSPGAAVEAMETLRRRLAQSTFLVRAAAERRLRGRGTPERRRGAAGRKGRPGPHAHRRPAAPPGRKGIQVTISVGVAGVAGRADKPSAVLHRADQALYRAKQGGRNRVVSARGAERG